MSHRFFQKGQCIDGQTYARHCGAPKVSRGALFKGAISAPVIVLRTPLADVAEGRPGEAGTEAMASHTCGRASIAQPLWARRGNCK